MSSIKLHENLFVGSRVVPCGRTDRQIGRETDRRTDRKIDIQQSLFAILRTPVKLQRFRCLHSLPFFVCLSHLSRNKWTIFKHLCALSLPANLFLLLSVMKLIEIQRWIFCFISLSIIPFIPFYLPSPPPPFFQTLTGVAWKQQIHLCLCHSAQLKWALHGNDTVYTLIA